MSFMITFGFASTKLLRSPAWIYLLAFGIAQLVSTAAWPIAILAVESGRRPRLARLSAVARTHQFRFTVFK
jgi:hypothetical protein